MPGPRSTLTCFINANPKHAQDVGGIKLLHGSDFIIESTPYYSMRIKRENRLSGWGGPSENRQCSDRLYARGLRDHRLSLVAQTVKCPPAVRETQVRSLGREDPLEEEMATTPVFLPGKSHGWRSLAGCSPQGHKESNMT